MNVPRRPFLMLCPLGLAAALAVAADPDVKPAIRLSAQTDRADATYRRGETVTFTVRLEQEGRPVEAADVEWTLTKDGVAPTRTGRVRLQGGAAIVTGTLAEPGFLQCRVSYQSGQTKLVALAGAGVSPLEIKPSQPVPDDFEVFWAAKKKALAAVPMKVRLQTVKSPQAGVETVDVQLDCVGAPVSGYFAQPAGALTHSLPAILTVHGSGVKSSSLAGAAGWAKEGAIALDINAHGLPNGLDKAHYDALAAGSLKDYRVRGRQSREEIYFLGMFLRLIRAIDFLTSVHEWDGRTLVVFGSNQGGAQALAAAGLDSRVTFFVAGVPAMCDHTGALANRIAGWPKFIPTGEKPPADVVTAVRYYDAVNFAARARAPGFFTVGFIDTTCPPTSVYAAYNALPVAKEIFNDITSGHTNTPAARDAMRAAVLRHFAAQRAAGQ
jgi:cephalosporin-C deacetylase-like acetyl esterase